MNNIANLEDEARKRERLVYVCDCDCGTFYIYENGDIECGRCGAFMNENDSPSLEVRKWMEKFYESHPKPKKSAKVVELTFPTKT